MSRPLASVASWLALAAAPVFALMAAITGWQQVRAPAPFCGAMPSGVAMAGMPVMYLLMAVVHLAPWLRLSSGRRRSSH